MGLDLGGILGTLGTVFVGNALATSPGFSIGGPTTSGSGLLGSVLGSVTSGLLGTPQGLIGSHNLIEADSSLTRDDLYVTGDASTMNLTKFTEYYNLIGSNGVTGPDLMFDRANARFQETVATNPNFYFGPFTGLIARNAGYFFGARLFANYSAENPNGVMSKFSQNILSGLVILTVI